MWTSIVDIIVIVEIIVNDKSFVYNDNESRTSIEFAS
jgi:hypothetical protein